MPIVRSPVLWIVLVVVLGGAFLLNHGRQETGAWGFRDIVKNPDYWDHADAAQAAAEREIEKARAWDETSVAEAVRAFVFDAETSRAEWMQARILHGLGPRTYPALLQLLRDRTLAERWVKPTGVDLTPETPFERACDLLRESPPPEVVPLLAPFLQHPENDVRKHAALILGEAGTAEIVPYVRDALRDSDEYVCSYVMMGLFSAAEESRLADVCRNELFEDVRPLLTNWLTVDDAGKVLLAFDRVKAVDVLTGPEVLNSQAATVHRILDILGDNRIPVRRERLLSLLDELAGMETDFRVANATGGVMRLLGQLSDPMDRPRLLAALESPHEYIAEGAAAGLLASHDLEDYGRAIRERYQSGGEAALSPEQRWCDAVYMCDSEVRNGGLSQYFVNSSGNDWREALRGFEQIQSKEFLDLFRKGLSKFGADGPSTDRGRRQDQLAAIMRKDDKAFDELESRWYKAGEVIDVLMCRFVIAHPEAFR